MAQFQPETQVFLQQICIGQFDAAPSTPLPEKLRRDKIHNVPAAYNALSQRGKRSLAFRVVMTVEPRQVGVVF